MFAVVLWDRALRTLTLVRDRIGEKPLYYSLQNRSFHFGSELKSLCACPHVGREINRDAVDAYVRYGYVPAPYSIYTGILSFRRELNWSSTLTWSRSSVSIGILSKLLRVASLKDAIPRKKKQQTSSKPFLKTLSPPDDSRCAAWGAPVRRR